MRTVLIVAISVPMACTRSGFEFARPIALDSVGSTTADGDSSSDSDQDGVVRGPPTVTRTYPGHSAWGDYIQRETPSLPWWAQPDQDCRVDDVQPFGACIHAGGMRTALLDGPTSCDGWSAEDGLNAFRWVCEARADSIAFYSVGLRPGVPVAVLLDGTAGFHANQVIISSVTGDVQRSELAVWWDNPVVSVPPETGAPISLAQAGAVYVVAESRETAGLTIDADHVTLIVPPGVVLSSDSTVTTSVVEVQDRHSFWIEGHLRVVSTATGLDLDGTRQTLARGLDVDGARLGIRAANVHGTALRHFKSSNAASYGLLLSNATDVSMTDLFIDNAGSWSPGTSGILIELNSRVTLVGTLSTSGIPYNLLAVDSSQLTMLDTSLVNSYYDVGSFRRITDLILANTVAANSDDGFTLEEVASAVVVDLVSAHQRQSGVTLSNSTSVDVRGTFVTGNNGTADCVTTGGDGSGFDGPDCTRLDGTLTRIQDVSLASSFVGPVTTDDSANDSDVLGLQAIAATAHWLPVESPFRGWAIDGSFPDDLADKCRSGDCRLWDFRLDSLDAVLRNRSAAPTGAFAAAEPCPQDASGDAALADTFGNVFLYHARELLDDGSGDEDGLCESAEACVYSPHFGAFQGGAAAGTTCLFADGTVVDVALFRPEDS